MLHIETISNPMRAMYHKSTANITLFLFFFDSDGIELRPHDCYAGALPSLVAILLLIPTAVAEVTDMYHSAQFNG
jgi:hypothetical protein